MDRAPALKAFDQSSLGSQWVHEIKSTAIGWPPGSIRHGRLFTRTGLDWTAKFAGTAAAFAKLKVKTTYIDGELAASGLTV